MGEEIIWKKMSKKAPQEGNNETEVEKYHSRENNTPQTTYSLKSCRFKDINTNGQELLKV